MLSLKFCADERAFWFHISQIDHFLCSGYLEAASIFVQTPMICRLARSFRSSALLMAKKDLYKVLGVPKSANDAEIKKAYFKLAKELHPDVNKAKDAKEKFGNVSEAYETLSDKNKREIYDSEGLTGDEQARYQQEGFQGRSRGGFNPYQGFEGAEFSDFQQMFNDFETFFSGQGGRQKKTYKGEDINLSMEISFEDSILGKQKTIALERKTTCGTCKGSRAKPGTSPTKCVNCAGRGVVFFQRGPMSIQSTCQKCNGAGSVIKHSCPSCKGAGMGSKHENETINIPSGINSGQSIKLSNKGNASESGGPEGDLVIKIIVQPHPVFKRDGQDIFGEVPISVAQAVLGCTINIQTLFGLHSLKVEQGTQSGTKVRIKDQGVPLLPPRQHRKGDHVAVLKVHTPKIVSQSLKELYYKLAAEEGSFVQGKDGIFSKIFK
mmetsp:Transcript_25604/g.44719  ORF Transcript_25604/g.44719 Transcript_25604/m.44719 type:complete len:436 (-) Transcript_25604:3927-5234(-)